MIYTPALDLIADSLPCETDFCILNYGWGEVEVGIGECKSEKGLIGEKQVDDLLRVREKLRSKGLECYLIFSKTADVFSPAEIDLFHELTEKKAPCILFTNRELEPYEPYDKYSDDELPHKHAMTFRDMAFNSAHVYLKREPKPQIQRDTVEVALQLNTGKIIRKDIPLTEDESLAYYQLETDEERSQFIEQLDQRRDFIGQAIQELQEELRNKSES